MLSHAGIRSAQVVTNLNSNSNFLKHTPPEVRGAQGETTLKTRASLLA